MQQNIFKSTPKRVCIVLWQNALKEKVYKTMIADAWSRGLDNDKGRGWVTTGENRNKDVAVDTSSHVEG